ncbi:bifunctional phosphoribosyl-AMP cyclohydrolase/phosphoribosyl-ATP diphosphatase HisIE [Butyrivibrio sp. YAB3001]|uniref:bifunctional phosphoribosyl-AMP cyclohydrolase/phosphoribosyl-ATP diphosphatase HisIE n=1 Tax=Butyrivibrio sp. YAB3001 TaxID=1520812 RepID=UPI0008F66BA8|nr:bifunctional phosphoribosyl-AMP cyclohydrolase/phosphoribosyl-ATP diphosphatase HisIE [Butyrivibrio sp. YAB3001]SFB67474.1 phosphoribosyl-ATP pyrophosphatase /phosphoribosyl-AMP cyclohydrolase [Butyrivibrio sp. YAB3001]
MSSLKRKFVASIYLFDGKAFSSFDKKEVISDNPVELAVKYSDANVDEIITFDLSPSGDDKAHELSLNVIKNICKEVDVPVVGAGNIKRMEDIKKLLYAGCKKACLNFSKSGNIEILEEVSEKFGKEKISICFDDYSSVDENKDLVNKYASELIFINTENINSYNKTQTDLNIVLLVNDTDISPCSIFEKYEFVSGVTGDIINSQISNISEYKEECISHDIKIYQLEPAFSWADLKKNSDGMVPVIVQDYRTDKVLMLAYMNEESYNITLRTGKMTYFSRSRNELWIKGETSSHYQYVMSLTCDCDLDTILARVKQIGAACHTGSYSCFFNEIAAKDFNEKNPQKVLDSVFEVIKDRKVNPRQGSYTNYLFDKGLDKILKKVGEEATEMVIAAKNPDSNEIVYEMSDFLYHMMVLMAEKNVSWEDVTDELSRR